MPPIMQFVEYCILVKFIRGDDKAVYRNLCSFSILGENIEALFTRALW